MIKLVGTKEGQLLADVRFDEGFTVILHGATHKPIVQLPTISKAEVFKAVRKITQILKNKREIQEMNGTILPGWAGVFDSKSEYTAKRFAKIENKEVIDPIQPPYQQPEQETKKKKPRKVSQSWL